MTKYRNLSGDSNVAYFVLGIESITIQFNDGGTYLYTSQSAGTANLATMISLASAGRGLNSFINRVVKKRYSRRVR